MSDQPKLGAQGNKLLTACRLSDQALPDNWGERVMTLMNLEAEESKTFIAIAMGLVRKDAAALNEDTAPEYHEQNVIFAALAQGMLLGMTAAMLSVAEDQVRRNGGSL